MKHKIVLTVLTLFIMTLVVVLSFKSLVVKSDDEAITKEVEQGVEYLMSLNSQDTQEIENNIRSLRKERPEPEKKSDDEKPNDDEKKEAEPESSKEPEREPEPEPEPKYEPPTPTPDSMTGNNQGCYIPYSIDSEKLKATLKKLDDGDISITKVFENTLFVGDSITAGIGGYGYADNCYAEVGASLSRYMDSGMMNAIVSFNPEYLVLHFGLNEISLYDYHLDAFIDNYTDCLIELKSRLPQTKIIVMSLTPVTQTAIDEQERMVRIDDYNVRIKNMCVGLGVGYEDDADRFKANGDCYSRDGIHFSSSLYGEWLRDFIEQMGVY